MLPHEFSEMVKAALAKSLGRDGQSKKISRDSEFYKRSISAITNIERVRYLLNETLELLDQVMVYVQ